MPIFYGGIFRKRPFRFNRKRPAGAYVNAGAKSLTGNTGSYSVTGATATLKVGRFLSETTVA